MAGIASKNPFDLLGNDNEEDAGAGQPSKTGDKSGARTVKRTPAPESRGATRGRGGSDGFRDRQTRAPATQGREENHRGGDDRPRYNNRGEDGGERRARGDGRGRGRGRGYRGGAPRDDRHSRTGVTDHEKQVAHGWGGNKGGDEWADERAGDAIAKADEKDAAREVASADAEGLTAAPAEGEQASREFDEEPEEPEQKTKSYDDYLAEQAEKKLQLSGELSTRSANEGSSKKFPQGKTFERDEEDYFIGSEGKARRERSKKEKTVLELDGDAMRPQEPRSERGGRGGMGRGRGRGDRSERGDRGEFRERGDRPERSEFRGERSERGERGDFRGRGRGGDRGRGEFRGRGGRGGANSGIRIDDQSAFPSLGS